MNETEKIDLIEQRLKQAYSEADAAPLVPKSWRDNVMAAILSEEIVEDIRIERTTVRLLHLSWVAAGIAACYVLVFSLFYYTNNSGIEHDLQNFYIDNTVAEFIPGESQ